MAQIGERIKKHFNLWDLRKKVVDSRNVEFGYELISVIPYAYYLYAHGKLRGTISGIGSRPFYYFSPRHRINRAPQSYNNTEKLTTPNRKIHDTLDTSQFLPPPYKKIYKNEKYHFDLVVYNRYNNEWPGKTGLDRPINYFSLEFLEEVFRYPGKILYVNVAGLPALYDHSPPMDMGDFEFIKKFKNVTNIHDLEEDFNTAQLVTFANCPLFLTMNGGGSILASYFGGKNIIFCKRTECNGKVYPRELQTGDFSYYHLFGGAEIVNVNTYEHILKEIGLN